MTRNGVSVEPIDEWDVDTAAELVPLIDMERVISQKNKEITRLTRALEDKEKAIRALASWDRRRSRKFYIADILMILLTIVYGYSVLSK